MCARLAAVYEYVADRGPIEMLVRNIEADKFKFGRDGRLIEMALGCICLECKVMEWKWIGRGEWNGRVRADLLVTLGLIFGMDNADYQVKSDLIICFGYWRG